MKELQKKAVEIFNQYGTVILITVCGQTKVLHRENDIKATFKLAQKGLIEEIVDVR